MHRSTPQAPQHAVTRSVPGLSGVQIGSLFRRVLESEALEREVHAARGCQLRRLVRIFWKTFENSHCPSLASKDPAWRRPGPGLTSTPLRTQVPCSARAGTRRSVSPAGPGRGQGASRGLCSGARLSASQVQKRRRRPPRVVSGGQLASEWNGEA